MEKQLGAVPKGNNQFQFTVWAPNADDVQLILSNEKEDLIKMQKDEDGYWTCISNAGKGSRYKFQLNGKIQRPDPASKSQPDGVHEASEVVDPSQFNWKMNKWNEIPVEKMILYEIHPGTFTEQSNFEGIISKIPYLKELGINAVEIMPVSQFPGNRNWGYDGVYPFAVQNSYGGPEGFVKLIDAMHEAGIAVVLDVVYNHMGPEGNYLNDYGPYFTDKYKTPWGSALNFDDAYCDHVRNYFIQNALMWFRDYKIDALRLDAVHAIMDFGAKHFLQELGEECEKAGKAAGRKFQLIAESDLNDIRMVKTRPDGGFGMDAQWLDEFHHAIHAYLTGEKKGYYSDFGDFENIVKTYEQTFVYNGNYSKHRKKKYGSNASGLPSSRFLTFTQNHDQVGNRMAGDRTSAILSFEALKLFAASLFVSPYVPLLFMGEEYAADTPFQYFVSHTDPELVEAVRQGRKREFESFNWQGETPDPQGEKTFKDSTLKWDFQNGNKASMLQCYKDLIHLKNNHPVLSVNDKTGMKVQADKNKNLIILTRMNGENQVKCFLNFGKETQEIDHDLNGFELILNTADKKYSGPGNSGSNTDSKIKINAESAIIYGK